MSASNLMDEWFNSEFPTSVTNKYSLENNAELVRLWVRNSYKINAILKKQPNCKIITSEGFEVDFNSIDYHTSYKSSHDYELCFFPCNRRGDGDAIPWFKYSRSYTYAVYDTMSDSTAQYAYGVLYEIMVILFKLIARDEVTSKSKAVLSTAFETESDWYRVNDGVYYINKVDNTVVYQYSDWTELPLDELLETVVVNSVYACDNPVDENSVHFITIKHNKELMYRDNAYKYVSSVFDAIRNNSNISIEERVMMISEIKCIDTFNDARKSVCIKRNNLKHDILTKAIENERNNLDNILFGLYEKL